MKIQSYSMSLSSTHEQTGYNKTSENLTYWDDRGAKKKQGDTFELGKNPVTQSAYRPVSAEKKDAEMPSEGDIKLFVLKQLLERLFGAKFRVMSQDDLPDEGDVTVPECCTDESVENAPEGWGFSYDFTEEQYRMEQVTFAAKGEVTLEDGTVISFEADFLMKSETYSRRSVSVKAGDALIDPLTLSTNSGAVLTDNKVPFDINADGTEELIPELADGVYFLALDRNNNGKIDDGSELFGPMSGNGFNELRLLDSDGNGWIDENDSIFYALKLWRKTSEGETLLDLASQNIGAILAHAVETPVALTNDNDLLGRMRESGMYLNENGTPGLVREIDVKI